jgi:quinol monooxygenase YgiN
MHVEYIRYNVDRDSADAFVGAYTQAVALLCRSPLVEAAEVARHDDRRGEFVVRVEWQSREAQREYLKTPDYAAFMDLVRAHLPGFVSMDFYAPVAKGVAAR